MKTKEEILKEATKRTLNINEGSPLHDAVMKAMEEYAQQRIKNCSILAAINSGKATCPDCGDRGWLYDNDGRRIGTCPCHY